MELITINLNTNNPNDKQNVIYTDQLDTRLKLKIAYDMYSEMFRGYKQYYKLGRHDKTYLSGCDKWCDEFYFEVKDFLNDFSKEVGNDEISKFKTIVKKTNKTFDDYLYLREFMPMFLKKVGIRDIVREKDNPETAIEDDLFK